MTNLFYFLIHLIIKNNKIDVTYNIFFCLKLKRLENYILNKVFNNSTTDRTKKYFILLLN